MTLDPKKIRKLAEILTAVSTELNKLSDDQAGGPRTVTITFSAPPPKVAKKKPLPPVLPPQS